ncbi:MAG: WG repeat-containing protein [Candidatus Gastranaerophilales bacterium]|nr:WG repeat-containing protein [Candidatus Gastranaerophilales bacterium]
MKKFLIIVGILLLTHSSAFAIDESVKLSGKDLVTFSQDEKWGIKDKNGNTIIEPIYLKMIRLGNSSWIVQNKKRKFGLIDNSGSVLVPIKFNHADRVVSKFAKFGNNKDYGIYDENGNIIVKPEYDKIDILYGQMFLTYKNYKYGIVGYDGKIILENEFDDIYMPKPNVMRIEYNGKWYELEQVNAETLTLPADAKTNLATKEDLDLRNIVVNTGVMSGYSVLTFSDYLIKIFSSISPAHEDTIDELMLSQGADTVNILIKLTWIPKYPVVYIKKYYENIRNPNNGPLSGVRKELKQKTK